MSSALLTCVMSNSTFEWTPKFWQGWRESANPYRRYKSERDRRLALQLLELRDRDRLLEIGCGYGWVSQVLWRSAKIEWFGVDRSEKMVKGLCAAHPERNPSVLSADACTLPFKDAEFDKVVCTGVLMHIADYTTAARELVRILRPGGMLLCSFNNSLSPWSFPARLWNQRKRGFVQKFLTPASFRQLLHDADIRIDAVVGDSVIATVPVEVGRFTFPPAMLHTFVCKLDRWITHHYPYMAYEVWVRGVKGMGSCAS
jgi:SAM-dependent methyltransferase